MDNTSVIDLFIIAGVLFVAIVISTHLQRVGEIAKALKEEGPVTLLRRQPPSP